MSLPEPLISSPCRRQCTAVAGACVACGRTLTEVQSWGAFTEARRIQVMTHELPLRQQLRAAHEPAQGQRLGLADRDRVLAHLVSLSEDDRRSRFGHGLSLAGLTRWVDRLDWQGQWLWHPHGANEPVLALLHLAPAGESHTWEMGISVSPQARGQGLGRALLNQALTVAGQHSPGGQLRLHGAATNPRLAQLCQIAQTQILEGEIHAVFQLPEVGTD